MRRVRVIPVLQIENRKLVKTTCFRNSVYVGDPLNAIRIFNDKQVDEIVIIDIAATKNKKEPDVEFLQQLAGECFIPMSYGGGITTLEQASAIFRIGIEKIIIGSSFYRNPDLITQVSGKYGAQSVVVSVDIRKNWLQKNKVYVNSGAVDTGLTPLAYATLAEQKGAGEILLQFIEKENTGAGYDLKLVEEISNAVGVPVVPLGGANSVDDFFKAIKAGAAAAAAGSMFIYKGVHKAVLINYPDQQQLTERLYRNL